MANDPKIISGDIIAFDDNTGMGKIRPNAGSEIVIFHFEDLLQLGAVKDGDEAEILLGLEQTPVSVTNIPALFNVAEKNWEVPLQEASTVVIASTPTPRQAEIDDQPDFGAVYDRYLDASSQPIPVRATPRNDRPSAQAHDGQPDAAWRDAAGDVARQRITAQTEQPDFPENFGQDTPIFGGADAARPTNPAQIADASSTDKRQAGRVKFFNIDKGFGFIEPDNNGNDIFVHTTKVPAGLVLTQDMRITFGTQPGRKGGLEAIDVRLETAPTASADDIARYSGAPAATSSRPVVVVKRTSRKPPPGAEGQS